MASRNSLEYGWFFLRVCIGLYFLQIGASRFNINNMNWTDLAMLLSGVALIAGLLVRPAVLLLLILIVSVFVSGSRIELRLVGNSVTEVLAIIGFLIGGGGSFLALGTAIQGLSGKWYQ